MNLPVISTSCRAGGEGEGSGQSSPARRTGTGAGWLAGSTDEPSCSPPPAPPRTDLVEVQGELAAHVHEAVAAREGGGGGVGRGPDARHRTLERRRLGARDALAGRPAELQQQQGQQGQGQEQVRGRGLGTPGAGSRSCCTIPPIIERACLMSWCASVAPCTALRTEAVTASCGLPSAALSSTSASTRACSSRGRGRGRREGAARATRLPPPLPSPNAPAPRAARRVTPSSAPAPRGRSSASGRRTSGCRRRAQSTAGGRGGGGGRCRGCCWCCHCPLFLPPPHLDGVLHGVVGGRDDGGVAQERRRVGAARRVDVRARLVAPRQLGARVLAWEGRKRCIGAYTHRKRSLAAHPPARR